MAAVVSKTSLRLIFNFIVKPYYQATELLIISLLFFILLSNFHFSLPTSHETRHRTQQHVHQRLLQQQHQISVNIKTTLCKRCVVSWFLAFVAGLKPEARETECSPMWTRTEGAWKDHLAIKGVVKS